MASRDLALIHPVMRPKVVQFLVDTAIAGLHALITNTGRTQAEQIALHAQGRLPLEQVNQLRKDAGLPPIDAERNSKKVTWTTNSLHLIQPDGYCRAADFCLTKNGKAYWDVKADIDDDEIPDYEEAGLIAERLGLTWGGRWKSPDYPHLQLLV